MFNFKLKFSKKNAIKKCLSLVLSLTLVLNILSMLNLPVVVAGSFEGGLGTPENPWIISTPAQLDSLRDYLGETNNDKYFELGCNIDLTDYLNSGDDAGWNPIGNSSNPFCGHLNGTGYTVSGLWINRTNTDYVGLFGKVGIDGNLQNINLIINTAKAGVRGLDCVGGLVGSLGGNIINCYSTGAVKGFECIGGLVGSLGGNIINCYATSSVGGQYYVGGLAGFQGGIDSNIIKCYATGSVLGFVYNNDDVFGYAYAIGGLVGYQRCANITNCFATGSVSANGRMVGGLVGAMNGNMIGEESSITNCYATGEVYGEDAGGLVGYQYRSNITTCYATGKVYGSGGLVGWQDSGNITNCFFNKQTTGLRSAIPDDSGNSSDNGLTTAQMLDSTVLTGVMAAFGADWSKRATDNAYAYYPELKVFADNGTAAQQEASKVSVIVKRALIADITASSVTSGQSLTLTVPTITSLIEIITSQGWQLSENGTDTWEAYTGSALNINYNNYYLRYYATSDIGTVYSNKVQITVNKLDSIINIPPNVKNVWQGSELSTSTLTGGTANGISGSFTWTNPNTVVDATGSFSVTFTPDDNNYNTVAMNITVTAIDKSALTNLIIMAGMVKSGATVGNGNGQYPQQAIDNLKNAITTAETIANGNAPANQTAVNDTFNTLQTAIDNFKSQVIKKPSDNPKTDDNTNLPVLMAILFASLGALNIIACKSKIFGKIF